MTPRGRVVAMLAVALVGGFVLAPPAIGVQQLPVNGQASYQLGGSYKPEAGTRVVIRDQTSRPAPGKYNICYVNGFQTQPNALNWWRTKHNDLLLRKNGKLVVDEDWGEVLLDTSTPAKRQALAQVLRPTIQSCATKGFQAVEFDNLDSYLRSKGRLNAAMNLDMAKRLVVVAHDRGMAVGQKNAVELSSRGKNLARFDFAIAEECQRYRECGGYEAVYGNQLIEVEYTDYSAAVFAQACAARGGRISVIRRDRDLRPAGQQGYFSQAC